MTYNMEDFFKSCVDKYVSLATECGSKPQLKPVPTPFISEDHPESPQGKPFGCGPPIYCPMCRHAFSAEQSIDDKQFEAETTKLTLTDNGTILEPFTTNSTEAKASTAEAEASTAKPLNEDIGATGSDSAGILGK